MNIAVKYLFNEYWFRVKFLVNYCLLPFCSGSVQAISVPGLDGRSCGDGGTWGPRPPGFSDDEISLSPPRHSYVLELGPRHHQYQYQAQCYGKHFYFYNREH